MVKQLTMYYVGVPSCTCKDKISVDGYGNCRKSSNIHSGEKSCFVLQPTSCPDVRDSMTIRGEMTSAVACKKIGNCILQLFSLRRKVRSRSMIFVIYDT